MLFRSTHPLYDGCAAVLRHPLCFETFPQAIACALAGERVAARDKRTVRRRLLEAAGVDTAGLTHIDWIDAALCALAARCLLEGPMSVWGDAAEGYILVPAGFPAVG